MQELLDRMRVLDEYLKPALPQRELMMRRHGRTTSQTYRRVELNPGLLAGKIRQPDGTGQARN